VKNWIGFIWLRVGTSGGLLWAQEWIFGYQKICEITWLAEELLTLQRGLCCMRIFSAPDLFERACITFWIAIHFCTEIWYSQSALEVYCLWSLPSAAGKSTSIVLTDSGKVNFLRAKQWLANVWMSQICIGNLEVKGMFSVRTCKSTALNRPSRQDKGCVESLAITAQCLLQQYNNWTAVFSHSVHHMTDY